MKTLKSLAFGFTFLFTALLSAQNTYTVNGENLSLKTEVNGSLTLLWNTIDGEYRYFVMKDNNVIELMNTQENGTYKNEYRNTLDTQTSDVNLDETAVKFTLPSLRKYVNSYNTAVDPSFEAAAMPLKPGLLLGAFAGITNSNFTNNPNNDKQLQVGAALELVDRAVLKRHALVLQLANTFASSDYNYSAFQASLNYRFKFVMQPKFRLYANTKFVAYNTFEGERVLIGTSSTEVVTVPTSGDTFDFPITLGLGADIAVGNGFVTVHLDDLVGLNIDGNGEFPTNIQIGYKVQL